MLSTPKRKDRMKLSLPPKLVEKNTDETPALKKSFWLNGRFVCWAFLHSTSFDYGGAIHCLDSKDTSNHRGY